MHIRTMWWFDEICFICKIRISHSMEAKKIVYCKLPELQEHYIEYSNAPISLKYLHCYDVLIVAFSWSFEIENVIKCRILKMKASLWYKKDFECLNKIRMLMIFMIQKMSKILCWTLQGRRHMFVEHYTTLISWGSIKLHIFCFFFHQ